MAPLFQSLAYEIVPCDFIAEKHSHPRNKPVTTIRAVCNARKCRCTFCPPPAAKGKALPLRSARSKTHKFKKHQSPTHVNSLALAKHENQLEVMCPRTHVILGPATQISQICFPRDSKSPLIICSPDHMRINISNHDLVIPINPDLLNFSWRAAP